jgi:hypothetical protein
MRLSPAETGFYQSDFKCPTGYDRRRVLTLQSCFSENDKMVVVEVEDTGEESLRK